MIVRGIVQAEIINIWLISQLQDPLQQFINTGLTASFHRASTFKMNRKNLKR